MQQLPRHLEEMLREAYEISRAEHPRIAAYRMYGFSSKFVSWIMSDVEGGELVLVLITIIWSVFTYIGTPLFNSFTTYRDLMSEVSPAVLAGAWWMVVGIQSYALVTGNAAWRKVASTMVMYLYGLLAFVLALDIGVSILVAILGAIGFGGWYTSARLALREKLLAPVSVKGGDAIVDTR